MTLHTSPEQERAREILEHTGTNLFLTGKAGTGKTTFLRRFRQETAKRMVVLAPTGIAAINAGGSTIHSFFQLPFAPFIPGTNYSREAFRLNKPKVKLIRSLDLIVIDEISMVRADLLDSMDNVLRRYRDHRRPFGGVQLLMIGDLQQLPPVVGDAERALLATHYDTPYFFSSIALREAGYVCIELQHVYRQSDADFIDLLGHIREGRADAATLQRLNDRYRPDFDPPREEGYIRLVTHNRQAAEINNSCLAQIKERSYTYEAKVSGNFPETSYPTEGRLHLKLGAQIMFVKNDHTPEKRYYNGMLGEITSIDEDGFCVRPISKGNGEEEIIVEPDEWSNARYALNQDSGEVEEIVEGTFRQFPVRTAWAITIHKSQGLTFDRAIIDAHSAFAHGQTYVALSRLKSLEGLVLSSPIPPTAIITDATVAGFNRTVATSCPDDAALMRLEASHFLHLTTDLFDCTEIGNEGARLGRILDEHLYRQYPKACRAWQIAGAAFEQKALAVAPRFATQLQSLITSTPDYAADAHIAERIAKGCTYFRTEVEALAEALNHLDLPIDNKMVKKRFNDTRSHLIELTGNKVALLRHIRETGFSVSTYQRARTNQTVFGSVTPQRGKSATICRSATKNKPDTASDITHPKLFEALVSWRYTTAKNKGVPAYVVLTQKALINIANEQPTDEKALIAISGIGPATMERYGNDILEIVRKITD